MFQPGQHRARPPRADHSPIAKIIHNARDPRILITPRIAQLVPKISNAVFYPAVETAVWRWGNLVPGDEAKNYLPRRRVVLTGRETRGPLMSLQPSLFDLPPPPPKAMPAGFLAPPATSLCTPQPPGRPAAVRCCFSQSPLLDPPHGLFVRTRVKSSRARRRSVDRWPAWPGAPAGPVRSGRK